MRSGFTLCLTHIDWRPGLSMLCWHVPRLRVATKGVSSLRDGEGWAGRWASHDAAGHCSREHAQCTRWADGMRAGPLLLILWGLWGLGGRCGRRRGLKMQVGHLRQWEWHLSWVAHGALPKAPVSSCTTLMGRRGASVLQSTMRRTHMLGLLFWVALNVGPGLRQGGDRVQGEARRALVSRGVGNLGVAATTLEAGPQVLAGWPAGVRGRAVIDV